MLDPISKEVAAVLLQIKAIKLNAQTPFTWTSGMRSPIYCDNRTVLAFTEARQIIKDLLIQKAKIFSPFDAIAGVATAGIAWGAYIADDLELPFCYVRSKPKEHGMQNLIEGQLLPNSTVLVIEDLISTGKSSIEASTHLQEHGHQIAGVLSIFHYGFEETNQAFLNNNLKLESLCEFSSILEQALLTNYISQEDFNYLRSWNLNPKLWSQNFINHN